MLAFCKVKSRDSLTAFKVWRDGSDFTPAPGNCDVDSSGLRKVQNGFYCPLFSQGETGVLSKEKGLLPGKEGREQMQTALAGSQFKDGVNLLLPSQTSHKDHSGVSTGRRKKV